MSSTGHRFTPTRREEDRVTPLELFFDLVFVLSVTQCTALMAEEHTWAGIGKGLLALGMLWWAWVGYAWLTSVIDPEEGGVRLAMFVAIGGFLVAALCVPQAFGRQGLAFAIAYGVVRAAHIVLFVMCSTDDGGLRHSVIGLAVSTAIGVGLLVVASQVGGDAKVMIWGLALLLDMGGPLVIDPSGWRLEPEHFAERHGLILIIALGESMIAIGAAGHDLDGVVITAAIVGVALASSLWWLYFDVISYVAARALADETDIRARNTLARDGYSYLHFPLVVGIVLIALGVHEVVAHPREVLHGELAAALFGGTALYLLAHVAFYRRSVRGMKTHRLVAGVVFAALTPLGTEIEAVWSLTVVTGLLVGLIVYENLRFAEDRRRIRSELAHHRPAVPSEATAWSRWGIPRVLSAAAALELR